MDRIGFIGAGKMAGAMVAAILRAKLTEPAQIICSDLADQVRQQIAEQFSVKVTDNNRQVFENADIVVLAVKPQNFPQAVEGLTDAVRPDHVIVSIMAGVRIAAIQKHLPGQVVRVMPNTACLVGQMAAGFALADNVGPAQAQTVKSILDCAGTALPVTEQQLDAVTGLSGSGPAFVAFLIDSFIKAGQASGLPEQVARQLTLETFAGTAKLLTEWNMPPQQLIDMVSSPNGTTVAGRAVLEAADVADVIGKTVARATERSQELGK